MQTCKECGKEMEKIQILDIAVRHGHKSMHKCSDCKKIYVIDKNNELLDTKMSIESYEVDKNIDNMFK